MERYPEAFAFRRVPLKVGVHHQILAELGCHPYALSAVMRQWCGHTAYLASVVKGTHRHDLDGKQVAELTDEERASAKVELQATQERLRARRAG